MFTSTGTWMVFTDPISGWKIVSSTPSQGWEGPKWSSNTLYSQSTDGSSQKVSLFVELHCLQSFGSCPCVSVTKHRTPEGSFKPLTLRQHHLTHPMASPRSSFCPEGPSPTLHLARHFLGSCPQPSHSQSRHPLIFSHHISDISFTAVRIIENHKYICMFLFNAYLPSRL